MASRAKRGQHDFVVVANRLPVDRVIGDDGTQSWTRSPGGLVSALQPVMAARGGAWVGWPGLAELELDPFDHDGTHIVPVSLTALEVERYYEGFSNDTLWPLYHDVIAPPSYHREWWESYREVNERFARAVAATAAPGATVWVHDYQLQLVPQKLRSIRPDVTIGFFNHIPFPPYGIFSQLPWRTRVIEGLLGADLVGFQRAADAGNFRRAVSRLKGFPTRASGITVPLDDPSEGTRATGPVTLLGPTREVATRHLPISIDAARFDTLGRDDHVQERARTIREELGNPRVILFGVDRLDYTKGIRHRVKAFGELVAEGRIDVGDVVLVQVASPSRERVGPYRELRDEIELTVGRINGDYSTTAHTPIAYYHQTFPIDEMAAFYLAADVMLVTALRDGMNLVAKEYVATRADGRGVLVLSEFAGASDELTRALSVNPHDIDGLKRAILAAIDMPEKEQRSRMKSLRRRVFDHDVAAWSSTFLTELASAGKHAHDQR